MQEEQLKALLRSVSEPLAATGNTAEDEGTTSGSNAVGLTTPQLSSMIATALMPGRASRAPATLQPDRSSTHGPMTANGRPKCLHSEGFLPSPSVFQAVQTAGPRSSPDASLLCLNIDQALLGCPSGRSSPATNDQCPNGPLNPNSNLQAWVPAGATAGAGGGTPCDCCQSADTLREALLESQGLALDAAAVAHR